MKAIDIKLKGGDGQRIKTVAEVPTLTSELTNDSLQEPLVSGTNIKTVNGNSLLGSGNISVKTYQPFPNGALSGTLQQVVAAIMAFPDKAEGMAYLGSIEGASTPFGYGNAECTATFMTSNIAVLSVSSSNIYPYHWEYNTAQNDYIWRAFQPKLTAGTNITITDDVISATGGAEEDNTTIIKNAQNKLAVNTNVIATKTDLEAKQDKNIVLYDTQVSTWTADTTYTDYGYKADITITGTTASDIATVIFANSEVISGNYASVCETSENKITIYSKTNTTITIPTIVVVKNLREFSSAPSNLTVSNTSVTFDEVPNAEKYEAFIDGVSIGEVAA